MKQKHGDEAEFRVGRYLIRVVVLGTLLGIVLFLVQLAIAVLRA